MQMMAPTTYHGSGGFRVVAVFLVVGLASSCRESGQEEYERRLRETARPLQHAVSSDRLLQLMAQLRHLTYTRLPGELGTGPATESRVSEIRWIAAGMSSAAKFIPEILDEVEMTPEDEMEFGRMARKLQRQCQTFEEMTRALTPGLPVDGLVAEFSAILETCDGCHTRFRMLPRVPKE